MDFEKVILYSIALILTISLLGAVIIGLKKDYSYEEYLKECERKAILYDYIMEQNGEEN